MIPRSSKVLFSYICLIFANVFLLYYATNIFGRGGSSSLMSSGLGFMQNDYRREWGDNVGEQNTAAKVKILVFTSFRSGSSYVGHLFASNPNIFYMYEPLGAFNPEIDASIKHDIINASVKHGYKCIDKPVTCTLEYLFSCRLLQYFKEARFRTPLQSKSIDGWYTRIFAELQRMHGIKAREVGLDNICSDRYNIITAKIIRAKYLKDLVPLMANGLKVIYLVRDPRGVLDSRLRLFKLNDVAFKKNMDVECEKYEANIDFLTQNVSSDSQLNYLFQKNFVVVRYEDVSQDLYGYARKLYSFVGLDMPESVEVFAKSNAKVNLWGKPDTEEERPAFAETAELIPWRTNLPFAKVKQVQGTCEKCLYGFGYDLIEEEYNLQNISYPVIGNPEGRLPFYVGLN